MDWLILILAGLFEVSWTFCLGKMREAAGIGYYVWVGALLVAMALSMVLLARAVRTLPIGTAYAVWTGIGAAGSVVVGILCFKEPVTFARMFCLVTLIMSIVGLKVFSA